MNKDFVDALNLLAAERNLDKEQLLRSLEEALAQAFERNIMPGKAIEVSLDPEMGEMEIVVIRRVVETVEDEDKEITLEEAIELDDEVEVGMEMEFPVDPERFTRIAVQTTKQVITQKIREAEREIVFEEYKDRAGDIMTGVVSRTDNKRNVFVDLGRGEAIMPPKEQIHGERYMVGMRVKVYLQKVELSPRGPSILVSRAAPELLEYLMRQEIPEVADGTVEIKAIAREAGQRSKVAVASNNPNVDPIGACIGHRGSRIQAVTAELQRERVDIILYDSSQREFIRNALSPAKVGNIELDTEDKKARVTVGNDQLSLAIGKSGQNVRLAAKLTGYSIDLAPSESISDLDAAMQAAASRLSDDTQVERGHSAFDALFSATPTTGEAEAGVTAEPGETGETSEVAESTEAAEASEAGATAADEAEAVATESAETADAKEKAS
ncbi:MAG TPA: transcription termination factor NusA [Trueperaceae bacterium]|nr:transcription termination factor NusA [Trueperaceae bacterium]